jgi:hypothetical protein
MMTDSHSHRNSSPHSPATGSENRVAVTLPPIIAKVTAGSSVTSSEIPPLIDFRVTNPVVYLKTWWHRVMSGEGIDVRLRIHPVTAFVLSLILVGGGYGLGHFILPPIVFEYVPLLASPTPSPTANPWKETAYQGTLRYSSVTLKYYLSTTSSQAITLEVPPSVDLSKLVGKKIFAAGNYNSRTDVLVVADITDLTILPASPPPIPTVTPTPRSSPS